MKLNPDTKLSIVFWSITGPALPFVVLLVLVAAIIAFIPPFRKWSLDGTEKLIYKFAIWRNNLPIIKNAYDKAHLFDYIKDSN